MLVGIVLPRNPASEHVLLAMATINTNINAYRPTGIMTYRATITDQNAQQASQPNFIFYPCSKYLTILKPCSVSNAPNLLSISRLLHFLIKHPISGLKTTGINHANTANGSHLELIN